MTKSHSARGVSGDLGTFVSLYSGCGGLDLGFAQAGFRPVWANDFDQHAVDTYNRIVKVEDPLWRAAAERFEGHQAVCGDVREAGKELGAGQADLVIGGPPCQGFSVAGRMNPADPRSKHVFEFLDVVARVRPRAFVLENVAGLARNRRWSEIIQRMKDSARGDYDVELFVLNASHWGTPQARERMFLIGLPKGSPAVDFSSPPTVSAPPAAGAVLRSMPPLGRPGNESVCTAKVTLARNPVKRRSPFAGMLFNGQGRLIDLERPAPTLPASMGGNRTPVIDLDQLEHSKTPWIVEYHRRVVVEGLPPLDGLPDHARMRRITVEEAAALQSFPRDMDWQGPQSARYRQVGNAVPPMLAFHVASAVASALKGQDSR
ncbi:DNA cytosine methyltransferase [Terrabacter sp. 2TAF16]|uniref:DNA cytosine methyltransferase n=1 Tax=Terrabacter sp. 2TAF16 TaxID=3233008 RepID=UPI003F943D82